MADVTVFQVQGGEIERLPVEARTLDEATLQLPHGAYSVFRLYPGRRVLRLDSHLDRMRRSAALLGHPFPLSNRALRAAARQAVAQAGHDTPRVRLTVPFDAPRSVLAMVEPFAPPPPAAYGQGVSVGLACAPRERPGAKDSRFVAARRALWDGQRDRYEILLHNAEGCILEGTGSNFYAILDGELRTAGVGMLEGIARSLLLEVAPAVLPVRVEPVCLPDLPRLEEALLTSASRGVVPIVQIGETVVGAGRPGPLTARLRAAYDAQVEAELEPL